MDSPQQETLGLVEEAIAPAIRTSPLVKSMLSRGGKSRFQSTKAAGAPSMLEGPVVKLSTSIGEMSKV